MWYSASGSDEPTEGFICYAESIDGFYWERPELGYCEFRGYTTNNITCDHAYFRLHSVFRDAKTPSLEHYKAIDTSAQFYRCGLPVHNTQQTKVEIREIRKTMELEGYTPEEIDSEAEIRHVVCGAVSPDGLHWTVREKPLLDVGKTLLDMQNIACYDEERGEYTAYLQGNVERRRSVRNEFGNWSKTRMVLMADPQAPPGWISITQLIVAVRAAPGT